MASNNPEPGKPGQQGRTIAIKPYGKVGDFSVLAAAMSEIGQCVLSPSGYETVANNACALIASVLGMPVTMVLRLLPEADSLLLQGGTGWKSGMVGHTVFNADKNSLVGFTLSSVEPVLIENLRLDSRFAVPEPLLGQGLVSGISAKIPCQHQSFGIVAAFSTEPRTFSQDDVLCMRVMASMLSMSIGCQRTGEVRQEDREKIALAKQEWEVTVDSLPHFVCLLDDRKRIVRANRSVECWVSGEVADVRGRTVHELLHPQCRDPGCYLATLCADAWQEIEFGYTVEHEIEDRVLQRHLGIQIRPISLTSGNGMKKRVSHAVMVLHDITDIKRAEEVLRNSNDELERRITERTSALVQANEQLKREIEERRRIEEALRHSENEMRLMSAQILTAQEMERKRIASELHDGIGQSLSAIKFCVESTIGLWTPRCSEQDVRILESMIPKIQNTIEEVRKISMNLRPSTLDDLGILATIAWFSREFRTIYSGIQLDTMVTIQESDVSAVLKTAIFRVLQEALNNIVQHARADRVRVHLSRVDSTIELLIQDNGMGFDPETRFRRQESDRGFGITGMRERTEFSGGVFSIKSASATGTIIRAVWPIPD